MGPLFRICSNWHVIRTITNLVFYGLMLASYYYFMKPLKVSRGLTVLSSCLLLLPFSETMMTHMQMGNTYMSHVILVRWFFGMYLRLCSGEYHAKRKVSLWIFYVLLFKNTFKKLCISRRMIGTRSCLAVRSRFSRNGVWPVSRELM